MNSQTAVNGRTIDTDEYAVRNAGPCRILCVAIETNLRRETAQTQIPLD